MTLPDDRTVGARISRLTATATATTSIKPHTKLITTTEASSGDRGASNAHAHDHVTRATTAGTTRHVRSDFPKSMANAMRQPR